MITEDQTEVIEFLASSATHGGAAWSGSIRIQPWCFLPGRGRGSSSARSGYDYLDFSTRERRRGLCDAEVRLNRRTAPSLYRGVVAVTRERDGSLALGGPGTPVDWVVEMNRFEQEALFDRLAASGRLDFALMAPLAAAIARFHLAAEPRTDHGGETGHGLGDRRQRRRVCRVRPRRPRAVRVLPGDRRRVRRAGSPGGAARRAPRCRVRASVPWRSAPAEHRAARRAARRSSMASSSTTRSPASTSSTTSRSC